MSRQQKRKVGKSCPEPPSGIETHPTVVALQAAATKLTKAVEAEIFFPSESKHWLSAISCPDLDLNQSE